MGFGQRGESQFRLDGVLHLFLGCTAAAGEQTFDLSGGILNQRNRGFGNGHQNGTACLSQQQRGLDIANVREHLFDGHGFGFKLGEQFTQAGTDFKDSVVQRVALGGLDDSAFPQNGPARRAFQKCVAGSIKSGIDDKVTIL